jgi:hypothetical protein
MPEYIEPLSAHFWENWWDLSLPEIGFEVAKVIFSGQCPGGAAREESCINQPNFPAPSRNLKGEGNMSLNSFTAQPLPSKILEPASWLA